MQQRDTLKRMIQDQLSCANDFWGQIFRMIAHSLLNKIILAGFPIIVADSHSIIINYSWPCYSFTLTFPARKPTLVHRHRRTLGVWNELSGAATLICAFNLASLLCFLFHHICVSFVCTHPAQSGETLKQGNVYEVDEILCMLIHLILQMGVDPRRLNVKAKCLDF